MGVRVKEDGEAAQDLKGSRRRKPKLQAQSRREKYFFVRCPTSPQFTHVAYEEP